MIDEHLNLEFLNSLLITIDFELLKTSRLCLVLENFGGKGKKIKRKLFLAN